MKTKYRDSLHGGLLLNLALILLLFIQFLSRTLPLAWFLLPWALAWFNLGLILWDIMKEKEK